MIFFVVTINLYGICLRSTNPGQEAMTLNFVNHSFKLLRKHCFNIRVISNWNSLPYEVVNAVSLGSFKSKLDNTWEDKMSFPKKM